MKILRSLKESYLAPVKKRHLFYYAFYGYIQAIYYGCMISKVVR